ncbi:MAG: uracil phosphoribosyltransferase [Parvularculaceae bacterium]
MLARVPGGVKCLRIAPHRRTVRAMTTSHPNLTIVSHPLVQHKLTLMREKTTSHAVFRQSLREIAMLLTYELTKNLMLGEREIETPMERGKFPWLEGRDICFVSILRAGNGFLEGMLDLVPDARVGFIGLYRDHATLKPVQYYMKMPEALDEREIIVVDPMLATGNSAIAALTRIKEAGGRRIRFMCLLAAPEGVAEMNKAHPDVPVFTAALDRQLNDKGYIMPGLGDAGDRIYGTA